LPIAWDWAREHRVTAADEPAYLTEFNHLTLARLLVAQYRADHVAAGLDTAVGLLDRIVAAAQPADRGGSVVDALIARALAHHARGRLDLALGDLGQALRRGTPAGYSRIFLDEGPVMDGLLREAQVDPAEVGPAAVGPTPADEGLSGRETEVLRLLASDLTGPEIARRLFVSVNTLRTHTRHIFTKLDVNTRPAAVRRATELGLL
jgi:LuxR family maltose regulon positive regulatory protein